MENKVKKSGFLLVDKEIGPTSHDVVYKLRKITGIKKIGHAGTLDPFASGLLIVAIGRESTKKISQFVKLDKIYLAELCLGAVTETYDPEGEIKKVSETKIELAKIKEVLKKFIGKQKQVPPMFSAKKVKGKKLYELARKGIKIERQANDIEIFDLKLIAYDWPILKIEVHCSSGTYIRAIARDIGEKLFCGAYLKNLHRISIHKYSIVDAKKIVDINSNNWEDLLFFVDI